MASIIELAVRSLLSLRIKEQFTPASIVYCVSFLFAKGQASVEDVFTILSRVALTGEEEEQMRQSFLSITKNKESMLQLKEVQAVLS